MRRDEDEVDVIPGQRERSRGRGPAHSNLNHIPHRNHNRKQRACRGLSTSTLGWISRRELPRWNTDQRDVSHVDCDERHRCRSGVPNIHFHIANTTAIGLARRNLVVSSAAPGIRAIANGFPCYWRSWASRSASYSIPSDYDRPVRIKVKTPDHIIDYLTKVGTFDLQSSRDVIVVDNGVVTNFVLNLTSYVGVGHTKVAATAGVQCSTTGVGADTLARSVECASRNIYGLNIVQTCEAGDLSVRQGHA